MPCRCNDETTVFLLPKLFIVLAIVPPLSGGTAMLRISMDLHSPAFNIFHLRRSFLHPHPLHPAVFSRGGYRPKQTRWVRPHRKRARRERPRGSDPEDHCHLGHAHGGADRSCFCGAGSWEANAGKHDGCFLEVLGIGERLLFLFIISISSCSGRFL